MWRQNLQGAKNYKINFYNFWTFGFIIVSNIQWLLQCNSEIFQRSIRSNTCNSNRSNDVRLDVATPIFLPDMRWWGCWYEVIAAILAEPCQCLSCVSQSVSISTVILWYCVAEDTRVLRTHICQCNLSAEIIQVCSRINVNQLLVWVVRREWSGGCNVTRLNS